MVDETRVEGMAKNIGGKAQDAVGGLTGDTSTQAQGKVNQATGAAQELYVQALDNVRDFTSGQPFFALMSAIGVGVVLGFILGRR